MKSLGNVIWLIFGGILTAVAYFAASVVLMITIIGIPFGIQTLKLGIFALWPFGREVVIGESAGGCLSTCMNLIWIFVGGIWIAVMHVCFGLLLCISIVGIPFGKQHFKMSGLALAPFGRKIV